ncbi:hypothetical protein BYZ73_08180 [Rhodovulum viride]|uniref:HTH luxR-type domain-containing protein n=1 Tax=Rhodovulum viride TaxID=1231134 RepID=A0ABX9DIG9_9RHOB|nr:alpha/beta fold hydrolase [Rhodovulum viride]RAP41918.1 hypothetical protein BYZ73_08180 [Rhodovulum viride]
MVLRANGEADALLGADAACPGRDGASGPACATAGPGRQAQAQRLLQGRLPGSLVRRIPVTLEGTQPCDFVILFDRAVNTRVARDIAAAFDLSEAETEVLGLSLQCLSRKEIAARRGVSPETVKKQSERIFAKTGARSQLELTLISASMYRDPAAPVRPGRPDLRACALPYFPDERVLCDGRRTVTYRVFGDAEGQPVLFLHGTYGFCLWPEQAEREAARRGYRVIVPIRPGYGNTTGTAPGDGVLTRIFDDIRQILDREGVRAASVVTLENDSFLGFAFANRCPDRVRALIAFAGVLPMTREVQYRRMDKWHRFVVGTAHYTPALIPLVARAGFHYAARIGREDFVRQVYGDSPPDLRVMADAATREVILAGTRVALSPRHLAHRAYAQEMREFARGDWTEAVEAVRNRRLPVRFVNGTTDPIAPPETVQEFREDYPWIDFELHDDAGQFIFFSHWPRLFHALESLPGRAGPGA